MLSLRKRFGLEKKACREQIVSLWDCRAVWMIRQCKYFSL